jgi:hypothetical protein
LDESEDSIVGEKEKSRIIVKSVSGKKILMLLIFYDLAPREVFIEIAAACGEQTIFQKRKEHRVKG